MNDALNTFLLRDDQHADLVKCLSWLRAEIAERYTSPSRELDRLSHGICIDRIDDLLSIFAEAKPTVSEKAEK